MSEPAEGIQCNVINHDMRLGHGVTGIRGSPFSLPLLSKVDL
jgi:hypothetical protein